MSDAADRKNKVTGALMDVRASAGKKNADSGSWPLLLVDAVLRSESAGDANRQDELIEAIGVLIGLGVDESLTISEATDLLTGEHSRSFIISTLHGFQVSAEAKVGELKAQREADPDPDSRTDLAAQSRHHQGVIEAIGYAIELVNLSALPADNDQVIGELVTADEARMLVDLFQAIPEEVLGALQLTEHELPGFIRRMRKLANTPLGQTP